MLKGLLFDLDGVITDTAQYHFIAWKELASKIGIHITWEFNESLKGISRMESLERILQFGGVEDKYSLEEKEKLSNLKNNFYVHLIDQITPTDFLAGIETLLYELKNKQYKLALASASKNAPKILQQLQILDVFDAIVDPSTLKNGKPHPEIFLKATDALNLKVDEVVGIEDAYSGIVALNEAGIFSIGVGTNEQLKIANLTVPTTDALTLNLIKTHFKCLHRF